MVVNVSFLIMVALFVLLTVIMAVRQRVVVVLVGMPEGPMLPLPKRVATMVVRDMVVIVAMGTSGVRMLGLLAFAFGPLYSHRT